MKTLIFGVDPGQTGGICIMRKGKVTSLIDMPTSARLHGKGQQVDGYSLSTWLLEQTAGHAALVLIEAVSAMPRQGVTSTFRFGESVGVVLGVCGALQFPVRWVLPGHWKRKAGLIGKPKDASRTLAIQLHPEVSDMLTRKKDGGRADAVCIAHFGGRNEK